MSQSTQCLGSVVPLAMIVSNSFICFNISISLIKEQLFFTGSSNKGVLFVSSVCVSGPPQCGWCHPPRPPLPPLGTINNYPQQLPTLFLSAVPTKINNKIQHPALFMFAVPPSPPTLPLSHWR